MDRLQLNLICSIGDFVYINHDRGFTIHFIAMSILVTQAFHRKEVKTLNFSGHFEACDLKVGRYKQHVELIKCCIERQGHFLTFANGRLQIKCKTYFFSVTARPIKA